MLILFRCAVPLNRNSAVTNCPACAAEMSEQTAICPHCGVSVRHFVPGGEFAPHRQKSQKSLMILPVVGGTALLLVCGGLCFPVLHEVRETARCNRCRANLRHIGMALQNYYSRFGSFPPAYIADDRGQPMHSWRVLILPYMDEAALYRDYDFSEPWDGPHNVQLLDRMPSVFACPSHSGGAPGTTTCYAAVFGERCVFCGTDSIMFADIPDPTSGTAIVGEAAHANIPWTKPEDVDVADHPRAYDGHGFSSDHAGAVHFLMADFSVRSVAGGKDRDQPALDAMYTRDGDD